MIRAVKLAEYLERRDETEMEFSTRSGVPQTTVNRVKNGGGCALDTAAKIVRATLAAPAPGGQVVTYDDLVGEATGSAA